MVDKLPARWAPAWRGFLTEFALTSRTVESFDRAAFFVIAPGCECGSQEEPCETLMEEHCYRGVSSRLDMLLYAHHCFQDRRLDPLLRRLALQLAAELALWDPAVTIALAAADLREVLEPLPLLRRLADERGWCFKRGDARLMSWREGVVDEIDGSEEIHSLALVYDDPRRLLEYRIWRAQTAVLLPFVEDRRRRVLSVFRRRLRAPYRAWNGALIKNVGDLEISHIGEQLRQPRFAGERRARRLVRALLRVRNRLAHLRVLSAEQILNRDLAIQLSDGAGR